jgi:hypothetical protein
MGTRIRLATLPEPPFQNENYRPVMGLPRES